MVILRSVPRLPGAGSYDAAGNALYDLINHYLYDAEGRVCAVSYYTGTTTAYMEYIYDAEGRRVAKGSTSSFSCNPASNGFTLTDQYILGLSGETVSEQDGSGNFLRSNAYANGELLATYSNNSTYFALNDWLGSKRVVTNPDGTVAEMCMNLPFGDELICSGSDPSAHHFTGQLHDQESGNDYFGARYYANSSGRFMSPDYNDPGSSPDAVPYTDFTNPQSLNLYAYVNNNPLNLTDPDGHGCFDNDASSSTDASGNLQVNGGCDWGDFVPTQVEVSQFVDQVKKTAQQAVNQISNIMNTPSGPGCMAGLAAGGAGAGAAAGGALGLAGLAGGGVGVVFTEPAGLVAGGVGGGASGVALAMTVFCQRGLVAGGAMSQGDANQSSNVPNSFWADTNFWQQVNSPVDNSSVTASECDTLPNGTLRCQ